MTAESLADQVSVAAGDEDSQPAATAPAQREPAEAADRDDGDTQVIQAVPDGVTGRSPAELPQPVLLDDDTMPLPVILGAALQDAPGAGPDVGPPDGEPAAAIAGQAEPDGQRTDEPRSGDSRSRQPSAGSRPPAGAAAKRAERRRRAAARKALGRAKGAARSADARLDLHVPQRRLAGDPRAQPRRPVSQRRVAESHDDETQQVSVDDIRQYAARRAVEDLCAEFKSVCESAVDPLEIASALEFDGISDTTVEAKYGCASVFALAEEMYQRVPRRPAEPAPQPDPWRQFGSLRPALRAVLYALPGVCFPAGAGLLTGPGVPATLIVALLVSWSLSQGLAYLGYRRLGTPDAGKLHPLLLAGLGSATVLLAVALALVAHTASPQLSVLAFALGEGVYMLSASVVMVLGADLLLLAALAPGVLGSAAFLALGRPPQLEHALWWALAATPLAGLALAVGYAGRGWRAERAARAGQPAGPMLIPAELRGALPAAAFGLVAGGLLIFPVAAGPEGHGGVNFGALLAALPLTLSMGAAEWSLLWYRRRMQAHLRGTAEIRDFISRARLTLSVAVTQYTLGAAALMVVAAVVADRTGLLRFRPAYLPELAAYLALGAAMFLALLLQAVGDRVVPLVACCVALAVEIACRDYGWIDELAASAGLYCVMAVYATWAQRSPVRYAY